jgi:DNA-binding PadR family transcriptional regulator
MKLKLDPNNRKFIEIEVESADETYMLKYYEKNTKQIKALKKVARSKDSTVDELEKINEDQFFENLKGDSVAIKKVIDFYEENGNIYEFINSLDKELGKLKGND